jgi:RHS repeat-associated protein
LRIEIDHNFSALDYIQIIQSDESDIPFDIGLAAGTTVSPLAVTWYGASLSDLDDGSLSLKAATPTGDKPQVPIELTAPLEVTHYAYLPSGSRTQAGNEHFVYDQYGRLISASSNANVVYEYDDAGNSTSVKVLRRSAVFSLVTYAYDHLNRLTSVTDDGGATHTTYAYDANGNRASVTYPNGTIAVYTYNEQNRLETLTNYRASVTSANEISRFDYDVGLAGHRRGVVETLKPVGDPAGATALQRTITYEYDDLYRLTREHVVEDDGTISKTALDVTYVYTNKVGNRDMMIREEEDCRRTTVYSYDANDRLTGSVTTTSDLTQAAQRQLDRYYASRPRGWTRWAVLGFAGATLSAFWMPLLLPRRRRHPSRDCEGADPTLPLGRRARRRRLYTACVATFLAPLMAVHPEAAHALTTEAIRAQTAITAGIALDCPDMLTVSMTYDYDDNGNQIARTRTAAGESATDTYSFDHRNRLVGATTQIDGPPTTVTYAYDADGVRNRKTITGGDDISYVTDKNRPYAQVIEETASDPSGDTTRTHYTYGDDLISLNREFPDATPPLKRYYHYDGQMSTRQLSDDNALPGSVVLTARYSYDAFGVGLMHEGATDNAYRYTGEQLDSVICSYYLRARYYSPQFGRFASMDPFHGSLQDPQSLHKYMYANVNPINLYDPSGLFALYLAQLAVTGIQSILSRLNHFRVIRVATRGFRNKTHEVIRVREAKTGSILGGNVWHDYIALFRLRGKIGWKFDVNPSLNSAIGKAAAELSERAIDFLYGIAIPVDGVFAIRPIWRKELSQPGVRSWRVARLNRKQRYIWLGLIVPTTLFMAARSGSTPMPYSIAGKPLGCSNCTQFATYAAATARTVSLLPLK